MAAPSTRNIIPLLPTAAPAGTVVQDIISNTGLLAAPR